MKRKTTIIANSHGIGDFLQCSMRYKYAQIEQLEPAKSYTPFVRGTVITNLLSYYYQSKLFGTYTPTTCLDAISKFVDPEPNLSNEDKTLLTSRFLQYWKYYMNETWKPLAVEQNGHEDHPENKGTGFSKVLFENDRLLFVYEGEPDLVLRTPSLVVDHKSQSRKSDLFTHSNQFRGYSWATGISDFGINYFGLQATGDEKLWFRRQLITFQRSQIEQWKNDMIRVYFEILRVVVNKFYARSWQCEGKYGVCSYFPLCKNSYLDFIEADIKKREFKVKERKASW